MPGAGDEEDAPAKEPALSWERYLEILEAISAATRVAMDPQRIMQDFSVSLAEYVAAGLHWSQWFNENALRDPTVLERHTELTAKSRAKYATAANDQDINV